MGRILTPRLRMSVPDAELLEAFKSISEAELKGLGRTLSAVDRASALTLQNLGLRRGGWGGYIPLWISLREPQDIVGGVKLSINLNAFEVVDVSDADGPKKRVIRTEAPLEIGLRVYLYPQFQGFGYGLEASRTFIDYSVTVLGAQRIVSEARKAESNAIRLMERLGMTLHRRPLANCPERIVGVLNVEMPRYRPEYEVVLD